MLHQSGLFGKVTAKSKPRASDVSEDIDEEEEVARSMTTVSGILILYYPCY